MSALVRRALARRAATSERGQALVETGLILTLILLTSLATFDIGRGLSAHLALTEATQEGALYAGHRRYSTATSPDLNTPVTNAQIQARVRTSSNDEAVMNANVTVTCTSGSPGQVTVASTYALPVVSPLGQLVFGPAFNLSVNSKTPILRGTCP